MAGASPLRSERSRTSSCQAWTLRYIVVVFVAEMRPVLCGSLGNEALDLWGHVGPYGAYPWVYGSNLTIGCSLNRTASFDQDVSCSLVHVELQRSFSSTDCPNGTIALSRVFTIEHFSPENDGTYYCRTTGPMGNFTKEFTINGTGAAPTSVVVSSTSLVIRKDHLGCPLCGILPPIAYADASVDISCLPQHSLSPPALRTEWLLPPTIPASAILNQTWTPSLHKLSFNTTAVTNGTRIICKVVNFLGNKTKTLILIRGEPIGVCIPRPALSPITPSVTEVLVLGAPMDMYRICIFSRRNKHKTDKQCSSYQNPYISGAMSISHRHTGTSLQFNWSAPALLSEPARLNWRFTDAAGNGFDEHRFSLRVTIRNPWPMAKGSRRISQLLQEGDNSSRRLDLDTCATMSTSPQPTTLAMMSSTRGDGGKTSTAHDKSSSTGIDTPTAAPNAENKEAESGFRVAPLAGLSVGFTVTLVILGVLIQRVVRADSGPPVSDYLERKSTQPVDTPKQGAALSCGFSSSGSENCNCRFSASVDSTYYTNEPKDCKRQHRPIKRYTTPPKMAAAERVTPDDLEGLVVDFAQVKLAEKLGQGAFGIVHRGAVKDLDEDKPWTEVALKWVKDDSQATLNSEMNKEILVLQRLGCHSHQNVMSLLGITFLEDVPILILEYASRGSLLNLLRKRRGGMERMKSSLEGFKKTDDRYGASSKSLVSEDYHRYTSYHNMPNKSDLLRPDDVCNFAQQIAAAMEFLSSENFVHRDLAARNILVMSDFTLKVSDFGYSRCVHETDGIYRSQGNGRISVKWHAIESLQEGVNTAKSDVWSFGVVLWEIVTLGCTPYPTMPVSGLMASLLAGYRLPEPPDCPSQLHKVMLDCWCHEPEKRPSFSELATVVATASEKIENAAVEGSHYLSLDPATHCLHDIERNRGRRQTDLFTISDFLRDGSLGDHYDQSSMFTSSADASA